MRLAAIALVVAVVVAPLPAVADARGMRPEARQHYERGLKLYARHQYDDAIAELRAGLAIDPQPELLYALGQAERRRGHCDKAVEYYQSCLALVKDPVAAAAVKVQIERCNVAQGDAREDAEALPGPDPFAPGSPPPAATPAPATSAAPTAPGPGSAPATGPAPGPGPAPTAAPTLAQSAPPLQEARPMPPAASTAVAPAPHRARWQRDALGLSLTAAGVVVAATGGALFGVAEVRFDHSARSYQDYVDARSAPTLYALGIGGLALGGALVVAGVVRLAVVGAHR